jgi:hypothetical protein
VGAFVVVAVTPWALVIAVIISNTLLSSHTTSLFLVNVVVLAVLSLSCSACGEHFINTHYNTSEVTFFEMQE